MIKSAFSFINGGKFISRGSGRHITRMIDTMELIYVFSGTLDMFENEQKFHLGTGDFLYLYPGKTHGGLSVYPANLSFFWVHFSGKILQMNHFPQSGHIIHPGRMGDYISMLLTEQALDKDQVSCDLLLALLMNETRRMNTDDNSVMNISIANAAERILKLRFAEPISTATIAKDLNCNADYLGRIFHRQFHCTLTDYLNKLRLRNAASLLTSGYFSVKEAAYNSGFTDLAYFRKRFLREFFMRPSEYRRQRLAGHINTDSAQE